MTVICERRMEFNRRCTVAGELEGVRAQTGLRCPLGSGCEGMQSVPNVGGNERVYRPCRIALRWIALRVIGWRGGSQRVVL